MSKRVPGDPAIDEQMAKTTDELKSINSDHRKVFSNMSLPQLKKLTREAQILAANCGYYTTEKVEQTIGSVKGELHKEQKKQIKNNDKQLAMFNNNK